MHESWGRWFDLRLHWPTIARVGAERLAQKQHYATHDPKNAQSDLIGTAGEIVWSLYSGQKCDLTLRPAGDGGEDFPGLDVKATPYWRAAHLLHPEDARHWAEWYALVGIDCEGRRGRIFGVTRGLALRLAPVRRFGHGPQHALPYTALGPPSQYLDWLAALPASRQGVACPPF